MPAPRIVAGDQSPKRRRFLGTRVPPNLFAIALGLAGLALAWQAAVPVLGIPQAVPDVLSVLSGAVWLVLVGAYLAQGPRIIMADLRDPVLSPFVSAAALTAMILSATLAKDAFAAGRVLVIVFLAVTIALGGWLTGQWITGGIDPDAVHPGYFLPTAAGGLIGASAAAAVHLHALAEASFGIGVICWLLLASMILNRLITRPALPNALVPTMAIELGIPAVAGPAYFAVAGRTVTFMACALGGYAVLMALVQVRLIPVYRRLSFTPDSGPSASPTPRPSVTRWCGSRSRSRPPRPATRSRSSRCSPPLSRGSPSARAPRRPRAALTERPGAPTGSAHRPGLSWPAASGPARRSR